LFRDTFLNNSGNWLWTNITDGMGDTGLEFRNTTFFTPNATVLIPENFTIHTRVNISREALQIEYNRTSVDTINLSFLSAVRANITLNLSGTTLGNPRVFADPEHDGTFVECPAANCTEQEWNNITKILKFNISHWTAYAASDQDAVFPNISLINSTGGTLNSGTPTNISVNINEEGYLDRAWFSIQKPDSSVVNITAYSRASGLERNTTQSPNNFSITFNDTSATGDYIIRVAANDTSNNMNDTVTARFTVASAADTIFPNVSYINTSDGFGSSVFGRKTAVNISVNVTEETQLSFIAVSIQVPNGTKLPNITLFRSGGDAWNRSQSPNNFSIKFNETSQTGTYIVRVLANDTSNNMNDSVTTKFDVNSIVSFNFLTSSLDFGSLTNSELQDTADDTPIPFRVENDGSVPINISVNGTTIFSSSATNSSSYQFQCGTGTGGAATECTCNAPAPTSFTNLPLANITVAADKQALAIFDFPWQASNDSIAIDIRINVPDDEPGGTKNSVVTFEAVETSP
ncbi:MAG TPA: hypothetical protein VJK52_00590, partial [Candidatus Nanoarchaeia archaeon]|nr:hypothetical protein [Candidatus Nanoarchaeia archaeon]